MQLALKIFLFYIFIPFGMALSQNHAYELGDLISVKITSLNLKDSRDDGTGFLVQYHNHLYLITARHVLNNADSIILVCKIPIGNESRKGFWIKMNKIDAYMRDLFIKTDYRHDLVIMEIAEKVGNQIEFYRDFIPSDEGITLENFFSYTDQHIGFLDVNEQDSILAVGFPGMFHNIFHKGLGVVQSKGIVYKRFEYDSLYTTAKICRGMSGGPVLNNVDKNASIVGLLSKVGDYYYSKVIMSMNILQVLESFP
jgi:hypothetical protein